MDQDGLLEIFTGLSMIALGLTITNWRSPAIYIVILLILFSIKPLEEIRKRFTYPRTGYARFKKADIKPFVRLGLLCSLCALLSYYLLIYFTGDFSKLSDWGKWSPFMAGGQSAGAGLMPTYVRTKNPKILMYAVIGIALGLYLSLVKTPETILHGRAIWMLWYGVFELIAGSIVLVRFIFKYKPQPGDEFDGQ